MFRPLALALGQLHEARVCHLHICPAVIMRQNKRLLLTGFAGGAPPRGWEEDASIAFSPIELLVPVAEPGPWSDIYSLAAVLYYCMTGTPPPEAVSRLGAVEFAPECAERFSAEFRAAVADALACVPAERPQTMKDWCAGWPKVKAAQDTEREAAGSGQGGPSSIHLPAKQGEARTSLVPFDQAASDQAAGHPETGEQRAQTRGRLRLPLISAAAAAGGAALVLWLGAGLGGSLFPATGDGSAPIPVVQPAVRRAESCHLLSLQAYQCLNAGNKMTRRCELIK